MISANRLPMLDSSGPVLTTQGSGPASCSSRGARALLAARPVLAKKPWMEQVESLVEEAFVTTMPVTDSGSRIKGRPGPTAGRLSWSKSS